MKKRMAWPEGVNDERVGVEAHEHDGILAAEVVGGEGVGLPAEVAVGGGCRRWRGAQ